MQFNKINNKEYIVAGTSGQQYLYRSAGSVYFAIVHVIYSIYSIYSIYIALYPDAQSALQHFVGDFARLLIYRRKLQPRSSQSY